jgi:hypothetical protein
MAAFRDSEVSKSASAHTITVNIPAATVAGDLLVMFVAKAENDPYNYHTDWEAIDIDEWGIGSRLSSTCMWKIATPADITAGSWSINCSPSVSAGKTDVIVVAYDISDWSGLIWNTSANGYKEGTAATDLTTEAIGDILEDGITVISASHRLASRTGAGACDKGALRVEADAADTNGIQVYDTVNDAAESAVTATVNTLGTANTYHVIAIAFGPSAAAGDFPPCPDAPDGIRVSF